ncbi:MULTISPECIES: CaiB/BaiF CoA transferase family protein [unclassified Xanthobacter]|uniref:CaiB/BaiF CoA transferase family protein n=1 Tax=unclassified Xanthobacter TaxID=2623496 RepID=UPI001EDE5559|nr:MULTISPECIES: CaiB/BaiF CoA-transferase family protein [unclassified Xanthobacter]
MVSEPAAGPLAGLKVIEFAGIGPVPLAGMLLADMGADVVCIARPGAIPTDPRQIVSRGRRWIALDLKAAAHCANARTLMAAADVVLEGFRPGVMERLGLGPQIALADNPRLIYGRMTGWGQEGPLAASAGHDIDYIAITGALDAIRGAEGRPTQPLNLVGDYGGGTMFLLMGVLAGLVHARDTGRGQVVDAAMCDGVVSLLSLFHAQAALGKWGEPGTNSLDGGAPFYGTYRCADGKFIAVGALEPQFYAELRRRAGLEEPLFDQQWDRGRWPAMHARMAEVFASRTREEWAALFEGSDACVAPVLALDEAPSHPHLRARGSFIDRDGLWQAAPAPRFSATPSQVPDRPMGVTIVPEDLLAQWTPPSL